MPYDYFDLRTRQYEDAQKKYFKKNREYDDIWDRYCFDRMDHYSRRKDAIDSDDTDEASLILRAHKKKVANLRRLRPEKAARQSAKVQAWQDEDDRKWAKFIELHREMPEMLDDFMKHEYTQEQMENDPAVIEELQDREYDRQKIMKSFYNPHVPDDERDYAPY